MKFSEISKKHSSLLTYVSCVGMACLVPWASASAETTIRFAHHISTDSEQHLAAERFRDLVSEYSDGELKVEILPAGQMGGQREIIESVEFGTLEMGYGESGLYANYVPEFGILTLPYLYRSVDHWEDVVTGSIGDQLNQRLVDTTGIRPLNWILSGYRDTYLVDKEIESPEDFQGLKIRVPESPVFVSTFSELGAQPTPVPMPEVYTAMQTGVVDAMEGTPEAGYTFRMYEVADHLSKTRHILFDGSFAINDAFFQSLSEDERGAIVEAAQEAASMQRDEWSEREEEWLSELSDEGISINDVDPEPFQEALSGFREEFADEVGGERILKEIEQL